MVSPISFVILSSLVLSALFVTSFSKQEVLTIETENGVYDCIDFYKQPAFNHPLLRNLTFREIRVPNLAKLQRQQVDDDFGLKDGGCPMGTVPILRLDSNSGKSSSPLPPPTDPLDMICNAVVQTKFRDFPSKKFYGVDGSINLYKARAAYSQWSAARVKLINNGNSIEAGWKVFPDVYKDYEAHLYVDVKYSSKDIPEGPSFVQVARGVPLGLVPHHYGSDWFWRISIDKHEDDGNWWLSITAKKIPVGYWHRLSLTYLRDVANQVEWGGEVRTGPKMIQLPEMGTGRKANYDPAASAYIMRMKVVNELYQSVNPDDTTKIWDCPDHYTVKDAGYKDDNYGRLMLYGGPWMN